MNKNTSPIQSGDLITFFNIIKSYIGSGILAIPFGFSKAGYAGGTFILFISGCFTVFGSWCLIEVRNKCFKENRADERVSLLNSPTTELSFDTYEEVCETVLGTWGAIISLLFLCIMQIGLCIAYLIFIGESLRDVLLPIYEISYNVIIFISFPALTMALFPSNYQDLSYLSLIASLLLIAGLGWIFELLVVDFDRTETSIKSFDFGNSIMFIGIAFYSMEGIGLVPSIQASMKSPENYQRLNIIAVLICFIIYECIALAGYFTFGSETDDIILASIPTSDAKAVIQILYSIGLFLSIPLQAYPALHSIALLLRETAHESLWVMWSKPIFSLFVCLSAIIFPHFGSVITVTGLISTVTLGLTFPCILYLVSFHQSINMPSIIVLSLLTVLGFSMTIAGCIVLIGGF